MQQRTQWYRQYYIFTLLPVVAIPWVICFWTAGGCLWSSRAFHLLLAPTSNARKIAGQLLVQLQ
jgi:hypothetical protein